MSISYSIPAYLSNFTTSEGNRTTCQLKVFYVGETEDGRVFDEDFSNELVQSIPYTPVVAFYSDLKDDFIGHNSTQYIYGIVTENANSRFEVDDQGYKWFNTEVLLYTDRIDNIGEVAKKIVGHAQSLELDPNTVEYEVVKEDGKRKIHFKKGKLLGLSVLGSGQRPAFTGSEFFIDQKDLRERFENFFSCLTQKDRGASMENKEKFVELLNFIKLSYEEKRKMICDYAQGQFGDEYAVFVPEMFDDHCVLEVFSFVEWKSEFKMYDYIIDENEGVKLSNERKCFQRFVTVDDLAKIEAAFKKQEESTDKVNEGSTAPQASNLEGQGENNEGNINEQNKEKDFSSDPASLSDSEREELEAYRAKEAEVKAHVEELETKVANYAELETKVANYAELENKVANYAELESKIAGYEEAMKELEAFRLEKKVNLVNTYKDELSAETIQSFTELANTVSYEELEAKLAIEFRKISKNTKNNNSMVFSFNNMFNGNDDNANASKDDYASLVKRYSRKK